MNLLLVEDDDADAVLLSRHLEPLLDRPLTRVPSFERATQLALDQEFDAVVLDLGLPDAWGLDALLRFARRVPTLPIIVLTGTQEPTFADKARRAGAIGFVSKTLPPAEVAAHVLELGAAAVEPDLSAEEAELRGLTDVGGRERLATTAKIFGRKDLSESDPELWDHFVARWGDLLDLVVEQATFKTKLHVSEHLQAFADDLGAQGARPRDLIAMCTAALRKKIESANGIGVDAILKESRLAVLESMGHLASYYRTAALGVGFSEVPSTPWEEHGP